MRRTILTLALVGALAAPAGAEESAFLDNGPDSRMAAVCVTEGRYCGPFMYNYCEAHAAEILTSPTQALVCMQAAKDRKLINDALNRVDSLERSRR